MRIKSCASILALTAGLVTSNSYAGVTADGITAYRFASSVVWFTDNPADDPFSVNGPFGGATASLTTCSSNIFGTTGVGGLLCSGAPGATVETFTCVTGSGAPRPASSFWCLFSENPRTGNKAWAVKFVGGAIPTNGTSSIVRCQGTDLFDRVNGCRTPPSEVSIESGYIKLDTTAGDFPLDVDCSQDAHDGRMVFDETFNRLYICTQSGWIGKPVN